MTEEQTMPECLYLYQDANGIWSAFPDREAAVEYIRADLVKYSVDALRLTLAAAEHFSNILNGRDMIIEEDEVYYESFCSARKALALIQPYLKEKP